MTVGLALGALGVLVAVVAVLLQVLFCIALARFVTTGMAGLLRSRRGKDLAAFLVIPIFALYEFFTQVVPKVTAEGKLSASSFTGVDSWLRWLPPGQGYGSYALGSILGTLVCAAVAAVPVIVAAVLTSADPAGVRVPVLVLCAAAYGLALAWIGVRIAARAAEGKLPELCQVAIRTKL